MHGKSISGLIQNFKGLSVLLHKYNELRDLKYLNGQNLCDHAFEADLSHFYLLI